MTDHIVIEKEVSVDVVCAVCGNDVLAEAEVNNYGDIKVNAHPCEECKEDEG